MRYLLMMVADNEKYQKRYMAHLKRRTYEYDYGYKTLCWQWDKPHCDYPQQMVSCGGVAQGIRIMPLALACTGEICPDYETVSHLCHNKLCANPEHADCEDLRTNMARGGVYNGKVVHKDGQ